MSRLLLPLFCLIALLPGTAATAAYTLADVRGESPACEQVLLENPEEPLTCEKPSASSLHDIYTTASRLDEQEAVREITRQLRTMGESQVSLSLGLLQKLGLQKLSPVLQQKITALKKNSFNPVITPQNTVPDLSEKYLAAALRYHELKFQLTNNQFKGPERQKIQERIQMLELRYPLIGDHNFKTFKDLAAAKVGTSNLIKPESADETQVMDNYLFNDTPKTFAEIKTSDLEAKSSTGRILKGLSQVSPQTQKILKDQLHAELQTSLSNQLTALLSLSEFDNCQILTLHSQVSLESINTASRPQNVFRRLCECRAEKQPVSDNVIMGMGIASLGGLGLCLTPTGIGQIIGCPTAMVAGWGTAGAEAVNFSKQMTRLRSLQSQSDYLSTINGEKDELAFLEYREDILGKEMASGRIIGMIGFGVGHVGFASLSKLYKQSQLSQTLSRLTQSQQKKLQDVLQRFSKEDQTKAFVILNKVDADSRGYLMKNPDLLEREMKGLRCEIR